ncbi:hypothetical protein COK67_29965 [Bacillus cereus]|uniref:hypothetical protein n=1 Tax=Bacillus cereus TaxID=1396 RepID=UPI000BF69C5C|nr:hypothetical protein [Bacillus cereus]PFT53804.1 hypothetical protein COK67_29965 [Bacillus cereus]
MGNLYYQNLYNQPAYYQNANPPYYYQEQIPLYYSNYEKSPNQVESYRENYIEGNSNLDFKPAETGAEFLYLIQSNARDLIRSKEDYYRNKSKMSFLAPIDRNILQRFEESLVFNKGGYASSYYGDLAKVLSFKAFSELYARFGISMKYFYDTAGYRCVDCVGGGKECQSNSSYSCASTCGSCN